MKNRGMRRTLIGMVVSDKLDKTVVVRVERLVKDPQYKKYVRRYSKFMAHDEENSCSVGDRVRIPPCDDELLLIAVEPGRGA